MINITFSIQFEVEIYFFAFNVFNFINTEFYSNKFK